MKKPIPAAGHGKAPTLPLTDAAPVDDKIEIVTVDVKLPNVPAIFANAGSIAPITGSSMSRLTFFETHENGQIIEGVAGVIMHRVDMLRIADMIVANIPREPSPPAAQAAVPPKK